MSRKKLPPEGLWISPEGDKIPVVEHLITIQHHPEIFGLSERDVRHSTIEGLRAIAEALIRDGWVRFRHFGDSYNFEVSSGRRKRDVIEDVLALSGATSEDRVFISQAEPRKEFRGTVGDVFDERILSYQENPSKNRWRFT